MPRPLLSRMPLTPVNLPDHIRGTPRPGKGRVDVPALKGTNSKALISQILRLPENEVLILDFDTPEECERVGLSIDAQRGQARSQHQADIRVGIEGRTLRLWKDDWDGIGPTGEEE